jgi:hypothetical protein
MPKNHRIPKPEKFLRFDGDHLFLKDSGGERDLGPILTKDGHLQRKWKLQAVDGKGEWVKIQ